MWKTKTSAGMKDNPVKKALRKFGTRKDRYVNKLRKRWEGLSYRQQRLIILYLLGLFAAVDLAYIAGGFAERTHIRLRYSTSTGLCCPKRTVSNL